MVQSVSGRLFCPGDSELNFQVRPQIRACFDFFPSRLLVSLASKIHKTGH